jgi:hypothetical protein
MPPADVTVQSTPSITPPPKVPQTQVISVRVLVTASKVGVPAYNQGSYSDKLPIQNTSEVRTIPSSGCALCPWASALAAAGCCDPSYDASAKTFSAGTTPINPSTLLKYLVNYAASKSQTAEQIGYFGADPAGALITNSTVLKTAINYLVQLNHPNTTAAFDNSQAGQAGAAAGTDIPAVTAALQDNNPVALAVCFNQASKGSHQVLAVGIAKIGNQTFYVINDSGFGQTDALKLLKASSKIGPNEIGACTASLTRNHQDTSHAWSQNEPWGYGHIFCYRVLGGLQSLTGLTLQPPPY